MAAHSQQIVTQNDYIANEIPSGIIDGVNKNFTLAFDPVTNSVLIRLSGLVQVPAIGKDYTLSEKIISFTKAPKVGQEVVASYFK